MCKRNCDIYSSYWLEIQPFDIERGDSSRTAKAGVREAGYLAQIVFSGGPVNPPLTLAYQWDAANQVTLRSWNGEVQRYRYTLNGQLAQVIDDKTGQVLEAYAYDKAGNITQKTIQGQATTLTYNAANELTSTSSGGGTTDYTYDKAGRLISSSGGPTRTYGWLDKAVRVTQPGRTPIALAYWPDGQLAERKVMGAPLQQVSTLSPTAEDETFLWDGLALLRRGDVAYITEPHANGGSVIASHALSDPRQMDFYLNDLLGTSLAMVSRESVITNHLTAFGQAASPPKESPMPSPLPTASVPSPLSSATQIQPSVK